MTNRIQCLTRFTLIAIQITLLFKITTALLFNECTFNVNLILKQAWNKCSVRSGADPCGFNKVSAVTFQPAAHGAMFFFCFSFACP